MQTDLDPAVCGLIGEVVPGTPGARIGVGRGGEDTSSSLLSCFSGCGRARFQCHAELGDSDVLVARGVTSGFRGAAVALHFE